MYAFIADKTCILENVLNSYKPLSPKLVDQQSQLPHHLAVSEHTDHSEAVLIVLCQYPFDLSTKNLSGNTALQCCNEEREKYKKYLDTEKVRDSASTSTSNAYKSQEGHNSSKESVKVTNSKDDIIVKNMQPSEADSGATKYIDDVQQLTDSKLKEQIDKEVDDIICKPDQLLFQSEMDSELKRNSNDNYIQPTAANVTTSPNVTTNAQVAMTDVMDTDSDDDKQEGDDASFEGCAWEVECTETFWKDLAKQNEKFKTLVFTKIHRLANGEWHHKFCKQLSGTGKMKLYELILTKSIRIVWEKTVTFSPRLTHHCNTSTDVYSDVIRIWSLVLKHDAMDKCIKQIQKSNIKGLESVIKKNLICRELFRHSGDQNTRDKLPQYYGINDNSPPGTSYSYHPPASAKDNEYNVVTFYSFSNDFVNSILKEKSRMDFPFKGWPKENEIINLDCEESILLLGRSGTGKTTCCLYRLWNQFKRYWEIATTPLYQRKALIKSKQKADSDSEEETEINAKNDDNPENDEEMLQHSGGGDGPNTLVPSDNAFKHSEDNEIPRAKFDEEDENSCDCCEEYAHNCLNESSENHNENDLFGSETKYDHLQQVFITKNNVLCAQFKKKFYDMAHTAEKLEEHLEFERKRLPHTLQEINSYAYPLFLTTYQWLQLLDASLEDNTPFFPRNPDGSLAIEILDMEYSCDEFTETLIMIDELHDYGEDDDIITDGGNLLNRISLHHKTWQKVDANFFCEELWPQVTKHICDSTQISSLLVWMEIKSFIKGSSRALQTANGYLSVDEYQNLGHKMAPNFADKRDLIYKLFEKYEYIKKRSGYFDECDLVFNLFQRLSNLDDINWCIHQFFIDEVQDFTQAELTLLLHCCRWPNSLFLTGDTAQSIMRGVSFRFSDLRSVFHYISRNVDTSKGQKVKIKVPQLHTLIQNFRSHSGILQLAASVIDLLMNFFRSSLDKLPSDQGMFPGPKPVLLLSCSYSDLALLLRGNRREASAIEFGARQAIIVQSDSIKRRLHKELNCIVLTVFESKGLEFDDVLLYDFFSDSKVRKCVFVVGLVTCHCGGVANGSSPGPDHVVETRQGKVPLSWPCKSTTGLTPCTHYIHSI